MGWKWDVNGMLIRQFTYMHIICRVVNGGKMLEPYSMRRALELLRASSHPHAENPWAETEIKTCDVGWYIAFEVQKDVFWQKIPCSMEIYYGLWGPVCHPRVITGDGSMLVEVVGRFQRRPNLPVYVRFIVRVWCTSYASDCDIVGSLLIWKHTCDKMCFFLRFVSILVMCLGCWACPALPGCRLTTLPIASTPSTCAFRLEKTIIWVKQI